MQQIADFDQGASQGFPIQGFAVTQAWAQQNPDTMRAFVAELAARQQVADTDRRAVEQAIEKFLHIPAMAAAVIALPRFPALGRPAGAPARAEHDGPVRLRAGERLLVQADQHDRQLTPARSRCPSRGGGA